MYFVVKKGQVFHKDLKNAEVICVADTNVTDSGNWSQCFVL